LRFCITSATARKLKFIFILDFHFNVVCPSTPVYVMRILSSDAYYIFRPSHSPCFITRSNIILGSVYSNNCNFLSAHVGLTGGCALPTPSNLLLLALGMQVQPVSWESNLIFLFCGEYMSANEPRHHLFLKHIAPQYSP
jgi:hypothetical protein